MATENNIGSWICKSFFWQSHQFTDSSLFRGAWWLPESHGLFFLKDCQISNRCPLKASGTTLHTSWALRATLVMLTLCLLGDSRPQGRPSSPASLDSTGEVRRSFPHSVAFDHHTRLPETASLMPLRLSQPPFLWSPILASLKSEREVAQSCLTLWDPMDCSLPGSSVHGIFQARILSGLPLFSPEDLPDSGIELGSPTS